MDYNKDIRYMLSNDSNNRLDTISNLIQNIGNIKINNKLQNIFNKILAEYDKKDFFIYNELNNEEKNNIKTNIKNWMSTYMGTDVEIYKELDEYSGKIYHLQTKCYPYYNLYFVGDNLYMAQLLLKRAIVLNRIVTDFKDHNFNNQLQKINKSKCNIKCEDDIHTDLHIKSIIRTNIYCFPSNIKRTLITPHIHKDNLSSQLNELKKKSLALTQGGQTFDTTNDIYVLKSSELAKLFIHELIHYYNLDKINYNLRSGEKIGDIVKSWNIHHNTGGMFEAFTEMYSNILSSMFLICECKYSSLINTKKECITNSLNLLNELINIERTYSLYIAAKLLYTFGYTKDNFKDFFTNSNTKKYTILKGVVHAIVPYYIGRSILFNSLNNTIKDSTIDSQLKITKDYINNERIVFNNLSSSNYYNNLYKCFVFIENNNDNLDLSYTCLDLNTSNLNFMNKFKLLVEEKDTKILFENDILNKIKSKLNITNQSGGGNKLFNEYIINKKKYLHLKRLYIV